jgi:hypothetical protein
MRTGRDVRSLPATEQRPRVNEENLRRLLKWAVDRQAEMLVAFSFLTTSGPGIATTAALRILRGLWFCRAVGLLPRTSSLLVRNRGRSTRSSAGLHVYYARTRGDRARESRPSSMVCSTGG